MLPLADAVVGKLESESRSEEVRTLSNAPSTPVTSMNASATTNGASMEVGANSG